MHHNNDVIINVKTLYGIHFCCFHGEKMCIKLLVFQGISYLYRTQIVVNDYYWNTCKLVFTITRTQISGLMSVWIQP